jgi:F0F1-type ATP synthase membrane subunit b/b'
MIELLTAVVHEIALDPLKFAIELVQFAVLLLIIKAVAFGFGKTSKGFLGNMLVERRKRVEAQIARIDAADDGLVFARKEAKAEIAHARAAARAQLKEARATAEQEAIDAEQATSTEVEEILKQARENLDRERSETLSGIHSQLVDVVVMATRQMLDQGLAPQAQREMVRRTILESLDDLDRVALA